MRAYDYIRIYDHLLTPDIVALLGQIHEYKGEQALFIEAKSNTLSHLMEIAKIQSTESSNKIEGIYTSDKNSDNVIQETDGQGNKFVRFQPVTAWETPEAVDRACRAFDEASRNAEYDPLLLIPMFILDFLCIHPFNDGNGRMSRLLTLLLFYRAGYIAGKYISIEKLIEQTKETYYDTLQQSSTGWYEEQNDYSPFVRYLLGIVMAAYREFSTRVKTLAASGLSKPERIRAVIKDTLGKVTKAEIMRKCPDISQITIQRTLNDLQKSGEIIKLSGGRYTSYIWNRERE